MPKTAARKPAAKARSAHAPYKPAPPSGHMRNPTAFIQPKLQVGAANDQYEKQADAVADRVMSMGPLSAASSGGDANAKGAGAIQRRAGFRGLAAGIQRACGTCGGGDKDKEAQRTPLVQRHGGEGGGFQASPEVSANVNAMKSGGHPLPDGVRGDMENRFGADLGHVRIHTDSRAAQTADMIQAKAFTSGDHIAFNRGEFQPSTHNGAHLLAHEITHTFQQGAGVRRDVIQREEEGEAAVRLARNLRIKERANSRALGKLKIAFQEVEGKKNSPAKWYRDIGGRQIILEWARARGIETFAFGVKLLHRNWRWLMDNHLKHKTPEYQKRKKVFLNGFRRPLTESAQQFPRSQAHEWVRLMSPIVVRTIFEQADANVSGLLLLSFAFKEGMDKWVAAYVALGQSPGESQFSPSEERLEQVPGNVEVNLYNVLGADDLFPALEAGDGNHPLKNFLPRDFDFDREVTEHKTINDSRGKPREVRSGIARNLRAALIVFSAMVKRRIQFFLDHMNDVGVTPTDEEKMFWGYLYYNRSPKAGRRTAQRMARSAQLSNFESLLRLNRKWRNAPENALKAVQSYRALKSLGF